MGPIHKFTPTQQKEIIGRYATKEPMSSIGKQFGVGRSVIKRVLVDTGNFEEGRRNSGKYTLDHKAFSGTMTEDKAYWVGFLMADGNVHNHKNGGTVIQVGLSDRDIGHLEKFKKFVKTDKPIYMVSSRRSCHLSLFSRSIANDLESYGVTPRKSLNATPVGMPADVERHFWRGVVDGDGHIRKKTYSLSLVGSEDVCLSFSEYLNRAVGIDQKPVKQKGKSIFYLSVSGENSRKVVTHLYSGASVYLDRKFEVANKYTPWTEA